MNRFANAVCVAALLAGGCGGTTGPAPTAGATVAFSPAVSPTHPVTPATTATPALSSEPESTGAFQSKVYPYSLALPPGVARRNWVAATRVWDGVARVHSETRDSPFIDGNGTPDGNLFILGMTTSDTLAAFADRVAANQSRFHGCSAPTAIKQAKVAGEPATSFVQLCADGTVAVRVVSVHAGFGIVANVQSDDMPAPKQAVVQADLLSWLAGLMWR